jgi:hypothetical protein
LNNTKLYPDTAFCLSIADDDKVDEILDKEGIDIRRGYIGLNISVLLYHKFKDRYKKDYISFTCSIEPFSNRHKWCIKNYELCERIK